jgi:hypothetical protein
MGGSLKLGRDTYHRDGDSDGASLVGSPFARALELLQISGHVFGNGSTTFGRHETKGTQVTAEFGCNGLDEGRSAKHSRWSNSVLQNLDNVTNGERQLYSPEPLKTGVTHRFHKFWASNDVCTSLPGLFRNLAFSEHDNLLLLGLLGLSGEIDTTLGDSETVSNFGSDGQLVDGVGRSNFDCLGK